MKKIISLILIAAFLLAPSLLLTSCGEELAPDGIAIPKDMKIASNTALVDYLFFIPESWLIDIQTDTTLVHASENDLSSIQINHSKLDDTVKDYDTWWAEYKNGVEKIGTVEYISEKENTVFNGISARKSVYKLTTDKIVYNVNDNSTSIEKFTYKCMVIGVIRNDNMYVFLYTSIEDTSKKNGNLYNANMESVEKMIDNFRFTDKLYPGEDYIIDEEAPEGMKIASNYDIVDYLLYVPESWIVDVRNGLTMAHVSETDMSSIQVAQWNLTASTKDYDKWWDEYKKQMNLVASVEYANPQLVDTKINGVDSKKAEYIITTDTQSYKCMVTATIARGSVYVIVYTSTVDMYNTHLTDVNKIIENFKFN